jgi:hypothetical protein
MPYAFRRSLENFADVDICGVKLPWQHKTSRAPAPNSNLGPQPFTFKLQLNRNSGHIARCASTNQQAISPALLRLAIKIVQQSRRIASQFPALAHRLGEPRRQPRPLHPHRIILTLHQPDYHQTLSPPSIPSSLSLNNTTTKWSSRYPRP